MKARSARTLALRTAIGAAVVGAIALISSPAAGQIQFNTVALSGSAGNSLGLGPNLGAGVSFTSFVNTPVLNASGEVAFFGQVTGTGVDLSNDRGVWSNAGTTLAVVAREGGATNLGAGVVFGDILDLSLNAAGKVAFRASLMGPGVNTSNNSSIWSNTGGTLAAIARAGSGGPGPNLGPDVNFGGFSGFSVGNPAFNAAGKVAFNAPITGTGVDASNNSGIWTNVGGPLAVIARAGSGGPGPNVGPGVNFDGLASGTPVLNAAGEVAFFGILTGTGVDTSNDIGIWSTVGGTLAVVARYGSSGPGPNVGPGVNFRAFTDVPALNAAGEIAFHAFLTGTGVTVSNDGGIWRTVGGTLAVVARQGSAGPGPNVETGVNFSAINSPVLNAGADVAFIASLSGTGVTSSNNSGIWTNVGGTLAVVAREGSGGPGPNVGSGVNFSGFDGIPALNADGEVAFLASLTGAGVTLTNDNGIWTNAGGTLQLVVREGQLFDVDPGIGVDLHTISNGGIGFLGGTDAENRLAFNDAGLLTFGLRFTDGSSGIFTAVVIPEPAGLAILALGFVPMLRRSRPR